MTASKEYAGLFAAFDLGGMYGVLHFFCVAIYVVNILDILCLYEMVVSMSYFQT